LFHISTHVCRLTRFLIPLVQLPAKYLIYKHAYIHGCIHVQFSFRWFNCLLMREFSLACTLRLWDTYVAEKSFATFHVYVCAAVLLSFSKQLQVSQTSMIFVLQRMIKCTTVYVYQRAHFLARPCFCQHKHVHVHL
jgi:hypothetical protein